MTDTAAAPNTDSLLLFAELLRRIAAYAIRWGRPDHLEHPSMSLDVSVVTEWTPGHTGVVVEWTPFNSATYSLAFETQQS